MFVISGFSFISSGAAFANTYFLDMYFIIAEILVPFGRCCYSEVKVCP